MATTTAPNKPRPAEPARACWLASAPWPCLLHGRPCRSPPRAAPKRGFRAGGTWPDDGHRATDRSWRRRRSPADRSSCCSTITADRKGPKVPAFRQG